MHAVVRKLLKIIFTHLVSVGKCVTEIVGVGAGDDPQDGVLGHVEAEGGPDVVHHQAVLGQELRVPPPHLQVILQTGGDAPLPLLQLRHPAHHWWWSLVSIRAANNPSVFTITAFPTRALPWVNKVS